MWGKPNTPHHLQPRRGCKPSTLSSCRKRRRCLTMHNRWQAHKGAACGEVAPIIMCLEVAQHCSTSSTPNDSEVSSSTQVSLTLHQRLSMVKHLRRLLYFPVLRNLREEEEYLAEIAEPAEEIINLNNQINLCETHIPFLWHLRRLRERHRPQLTLSSAGAAEGRWW